MALSFPSDPINGAVSGEYTYDATKGAWRKNAAYPVSVTHSDVAPSNPRVGDQWWKSNEGTLFTYYNDGTSSQWVESTNVVANVEPNPIPAGAMMAWGSDIIPANWLLCDGSAVSRSTYASLFAIIGTQYGSGDGTTTFNLPNIKGRTIVGKDASQTEFDVLGETGGAKTHTLLTSEMPSHTHTQDAHSHTYSGTTSTGGGHSHTVYGISGFSSSGAGYLALQSDGNLVWYRGNGTTWSSGQGAGGSLPQMFVGANQSTSTSSNGDHSHTFSGTTSSSTATNQNTGGGGAHNNLQPYIVLNYIIKFSAGETPGDSQLATRVGTLETQNNATPLSQNYLINGAFDFWQRGTSFSSAGYTADRWAIVAASGQTVSVSQQTFTPGSAPVAGYEGTYYARLAWSGTPSGSFWFTQRVEDVRTLAGQTATISFWAKATSSTSIFVPMIEQNFGSGGSSGVSVTAPAITITTSWQRFTATFSVPSVAGKTIGTNSYLDVRPLNGGSSVAGNSIDIWGVQLEAGQYATPFRRNAPSIQAELAACQRYYYRLTGAAGTNQTPFFGSGAAITAAIFDMPVSLPVVLRTTPASVENANLSIYMYAAGTQSSGGTWSTLAYAPGQEKFFIRYTHGSNVFTVGAYGNIIVNGSGTPYIGFNAEL